MKSPVFSDSETLFECKIWLSLNMIVFCTKLLDITLLYYFFLCKCAYKNFELKACSWLATLQSNIGRLMNIPVVVITDLLYYGCQTISTLNSLILSQTIAVKLEDWFARLTNQHSSRHNQGPKLRYIRAILGVKDESSSPVQ